MTHAFDFSDLNNGYSHKYNSGLPFLDNALNVCILA